MSCEENSDNDSSKRIVFLAQLLKKAFSSFFFTLKSRCMGKLSPTTFKGFARQRADNNSEATME